MALALRRARLGRVAAALAAAACGGDAAPAPVAARVGSLLHPGAPHAAQIAGPALAVAPDGAAHLAWIRSDEAGRSVQRARLAGGDFAVTRVDAPGSAPAGAHQAPGLAAGPDGRIHVSWSVRRSDPDGSHFASDLVLASSSAGGSAPPAPLRLNDDAPGSRGFEALAVSPTGALLAAWIEGGRSARARAVRLESDGTRRSAELDDRACPCCRFAVAAAEGGRFGLLWRDELPGEVRDMVFAELTAEAGLGAVQPVHRDGWALEACPHRGGALAYAPGDRAVVAWYTEGRDAQPRLLVARGDARGFGSPVAVHEDAGSLPDRAALAVDASGRGLLLWERRTPVRSEIAARALPAGAPLGPVRVLSRGVHATAPQVVAAPEGGFVASWNEESFPTLHTVVARVRLAAELPREPVRPR